MPLPGGPIPLALGERKAPPSYLIRFPEDTWAKLASAADEGSVSLTVDDGGIVGGSIQSVPDDADSQSSR